ncbi:MAG TPA: alpha/beta fold hydrolase [Ornithinibacter sp.]|nr:alpha/beta fold hydrolase [Ornithinibacter sp.]
MEQRFGTARLPDGTGVAYALTGRGPFLVMAPGWLTHLELGWSLPAERVFHESLSRGRTLVRYDRPGCGMSDPVVGAYSWQLELDTLGAVVDALGADRVDLLGTSVGAALAVQWASRHPDTVDRLVLYGGWVSGARIGDPQGREHVMGLIRAHWGLGSDLLAEIYVPDADATTRRAYARYQRESASPETAVALLSLAYSVDLVDVLPSVRAPALVLHRDGDRAVPVEQGRALAAGLPSARFVELRGRSHLPAIGDTSAVVRPIRRFLGLPALREVSAVQLTPRQAEVAALVSDGLTNRDIAARLGITERSAESHVERIRARLGFRSRAQIAGWFAARGEK